MKRKAIILFLILTMLAGGLAPAAYSQTIEDQLKYNDQMIAQQLMYSSESDHRFDPYLNKIAENLNGSIVETFGEDKNIVFQVYLTNLGFNAVAFHRFIVFDSLLLESLKFLAMGRIYYGGANSAYESRLAKKVAELTLRHKQYGPSYNANNMNNPFGLPEPGQLTPEQAQQAEALFMKIVASWMAHEGSHCMRDHMKFRMQQANQQQQNPWGNQQQFNQNMNAYAGAKISKKLEKDADLHAVKWLVKSGYGIEGFITWLEFGKKLEQAMGVHESYLNTHPLCSTRIQYIKEAARQMQGY